MEYRDEFTKDKKPSQVPELGLIRKAVESIIKDGALSKYEMGDQLKTIDVNTTRVLQEIADKLDDLEVVTKSNKPESITELKQAFVKFAATLQDDRDTVKTVKVEAVNELTQAVTDLHFTTLKQSPKTDPNDPSDYTNVRLTNGKEFYNAVSRAIAGIAESFNPFVKSDGQTPTSIVLNADGTLPTSATVTPPANQNVTLTNSIPTGGNLIGAVVLASGISVAPNTGIQDVFVRGGQVVTLSGSVTTTGMTEVFNKGGQVVVVSGVAISSVLSASGVHNTHIDNWPTVQHVFTENPVTSVSVNGTVSTSGTVGGTLTAVVPNTVSTTVTNVPHVVVDSGSITVNTHTLASGTDNVNVTNFPTIQTVGLQPGANLVVASGLTTSGIQHTLIDNFPSGFSINGIQGTVSISGTVGGTVNAIVTDFAATQTVTATSGTLNAHVDNWPSGISVNGIQGTVSVSGTVGGTVRVGGTTFDSLGNLNVNLGTALASGIDNIGISNFPTSQTVNINPGFNSVVASGLTTSGIQHTLIDNFPNGFSINGVQGTVTSAVTSVLAASGVNNAHVDNWPSVQHTFVENPTTSVSITGTVATSGTVGGTVNAVVQNFNPLQESFIKGGQVVLASGIAINSVLAASGVQNVHVDNYPSVQSVFVQNPTTSVTATAVSGTLNSHVDNWPLVQHTFVENPVTSVSVSNFPASQATTIASGTSNINVGNFPSVQATRLVGDGGQSLIDDTNNAVKVNVVTGGAGGGVAQTQVRDRFNAWTDVGFQTTNLMMPVTVSGLTTSGIAHVQVDNFPSGFSVNGVQGTVQTNVTNASIAVTATSGTENVHVDNWPSVQHTFVENPVTSVGVTGTVTTSGTVGGTIQAVVQNFNPLQESFVKGGTLVIASGVTVTSTSGTLNSHVDNWPTVQHVFTENPVTSVSVSSLPAVTSASGTLNVHLDNFPAVASVTQNGLPGNWTINNNQVGGTAVDVNTGNASAGTQRVVLASNQPAVTVSGNSSFQTWQANTSPIKNITGSLASAGRTTVVSGVGGLNIKVFAFTITTTSTTANTVTAMDEHSAVAYRWDVQAITGTNFGAALAVDPPSYLFKTSTAGDGLALNLTSAQNFNYSLSYWLDNSL